MNNFSKKLLTSVSTVTLLFGATFRSEATTLPPLHYSGTNAFVTGGVGLDESTAIKSVMNEWPLALQFAERDGKRAQYVANVQVVVTDTQGYVAIQAKSDGPFMLAKVKPGRYVVEATLAGKTLRQKAVVMESKSATISFLWPAGTGETR